MKPLYRINANSLIDNNLWVCVYYSYDEKPSTNLLSCPFQRNYSEIIVYENNDSGFALKMNAGFSNHNFNAVSTTGSNPSYGIFVYTIKTIYPFLFKIKTI